MLFSLIVLCMFSISASTVISNNLTSVNDKLIQCVTEFRKLDANAPRRKYVENYSSWRNVGFTIDDIIKEFIKLKKQESLNGLDPRFISLIEQKYPDATTRELIFDTDVPKIIRELVNQSAKQLEVNGKIYVSVNKEPTSCGGPISHEEPNSHKININDHKMCLIHKSFYKFSEYLYKKSLYFVICHELTHIKYRHSLHHSWALALRDKNYIDEEKCNKMQRAGETQADLDQITATDGFFSSTLGGFLYYQALLKYPSDNKDLLHSPYKKTRDRFKKILIFKIIQAQYSTIDFLNILARGKAEKPSIIIDSMATTAHVADKVLRNIWGL